ncbi:hypothetical protein D3C78_1865110 [compost metagenome]
MRTDQWIDVHHHVQRTTDQIGHGWARAPVRHMADVGSQRVIQMLQHDLPERARARRPRIEIR